MFSKIFDFIKRLFKPKVALPAPDIISEKTNTQVTNDTVLNTEDIESITVNSISTQDSIENTEEIKVEEKEESSELLELQNRFETNQVKIMDLTDEELTSLNDLYSRQTESLKKKIENINSEISIVRKRIEKIVTSS